MADKKYFFQTVFGHGNDWSIDQDQMQKKFKLLAINVQSNMLFSVI